MFRKASSILLYRLLYFISRSFYFDSVKGLRKLRVIDASVIPSSLSGGTLAATVMIAERAADLISGRDRTRPLMTAEEIKAEQHRKAHIEL